MSSVFRVYVKVEYWVLVDIDYRVCVLYIVILYKQRIYKGTKRLIVFYFIENFNPGSMDCS